MKKTTVQFLHPIKSGTFSLAALGNRTVLRDLHILVDFSGFVPEKLSR
jgi:hypothetical protein